MNLTSPLPEQPIDQLEVWRHRRPLAKTARALAQGRLTVGFIGGSITTDGDYTWPGPVARWFAQSFPASQIVVENAAKGGTGSDSACLRVQSEILEHGCQLTFVEYAVNDFDIPTERRNRTREGLIRKLLAAGSEVVLVYTFRQEMYADMIVGRVPASIAELETLAEHYGLGSIWVGLHALNDVRSGAMKWGEWLPDTLHPTHRGSWSYAEAVIHFLGIELSAAREPLTESAAALPAPLTEKNWESLRLLPLHEARTVGPWIQRRVHNQLHTGGQVLETHTPGARLGFDFTGRGLALIFEYGKRSAEFTYRIDGGEWTPVVRDRPDWGGDGGLAQPFVISDELPEGHHTFEMEIIHGNRKDCTGTECRLGMIGIL